MDESTLSIHVILKVISDVRSSLLASDMFSYLNLVCAIGLLIHATANVAPSLARAEVPSIYPLLKPLIMSMVVMNFNMILSPIDQLRMGMETMTYDIGANYEQGALDKAVEIYKDAPDKALADFEAGQPHDLAGEKQSDDGFMAKTFKRIMAFCFWLGMKISGWIPGIIYGLIVFSQHIFLLVLGLLGPLAFAMSIIPAYENVWVDWVNKYITVSLWGVCALILKFLWLQLATKFYLFSTPFVPEYYFIPLLNLLVLFAFLKVPTLASTITAGGGAGLGSMLSSMNKAPKALGNRAKDSLGRKLGDEVNHKTSFGNPTFKERFRNRTDPSSSWKGFGKEAFNYAFNRDDYSKSSRKNAEERRKEKQGEAFMSDMFRRAGFDAEEYKELLKKLKKSGLFNHINEEFYNKRRKV